MADNTPKPALPEADPKGNDDKNPQIFWTRLRIVSLAALSVSFALLAVSSWLAARVAPIAVVTLKPHTEDDMTSGLFKSLADDIDTSNLHFDKTWTVNIGVWRSCTQMKSQEKEDEWIASDIWFGSNPPQSEISDKDTISKGLAILKSVEEAMDGLNTSLALQPTATGLTGLFITFQLISFIVSMKSNFKGGFLTSHCTGMLFAGIVFVTTLMSWIFQVVLLAASQDAAEHLNGLKVDTVEQGPVLILTSVSVILQLFVFYVQYQLFGRREKEDFLLKDDDAAPVKPVAQPDPTLANSEEAHSSSEHRSSLVPPSGTTVPPPLVDEKDQAIIAADRPLSYITEATKISEIK